MERGRRYHPCKKDGSVKSAAGQDNRPGTPRIFGLLRWHIRCRLAGTGICRERQGKYGADKHRSEITEAASWIFLNQKIQLSGQSQITFRQPLKWSIHGLGTGHHNDVPAGLKSFLIQPIDLPDPPPGAVTDMGFAQFLADGNTYPVAGRTVLPGIQHQKPIRRTLGVIQSLKNVIQFQRTRKFHDIIPRIIPGIVDGTDCCWGCARF